MALVDFAGMSKDCSLVMQENCSFAPEYRSLRSAELLLWEMALVGFGGLSEDCFSVMPENCSFALAAVLLQPAG